MFHEFKRNLYITLAKYLEQEGLSVLYGTAQAKPLQHVNVALVFLPVSMLYGTAQAITTCQCSPGIFAGVNVLYGTSQATTRF